jgi:alpha-tubulin suppressor-like RCC1 family protein
MNSDVGVPVRGLASAVTAISAGYYHTCALVGGEVWCWGLNAYGQLGDGSMDDSPVPVRVEMLGSSVTAISGGGNHTCALVGDAAYCWGHNEIGQVGEDSSDDRSSPTAVRGASTGVTMIEAGEYQTCAVRNGTVACWGQEVTGQHDLVPLEVPSTRGAYAVSTGGDVACALLDTEGAAGMGGAEASDGAHTACWGANYYGALGNGKTEDSATPVDVTDPNASDGVSSASIDQISAGPEITCAIARGAAYCWGFNLWSSVGDGTTVDRHVPTPVLGLSSGVTAISVGGEARNCAIERGNVYCWGTGSWPTGSTVPERVTVE